METFVLCSIYPGIIIITRWCLLLSDDELGAPYQSEMTTDGPSSFSSWTIGPTANQIDAACDCVRMSMGLTVVLLTEVEFYTWT